MRGGDDRKAVICSHPTEIAPKNIIVPIRNFLRIITFGISQRLLSCPKILILKIYE